MSRLNVAVAKPPIFTHEGGRAVSISAEQDLRRSLMTCMLWEDGFYQTGSGIAARIAELIPKVSPAVVAQMAIEARDRMQLRHAPLFVARELARVKGTGPLVEATLSHIIQRADELSEFLAMYWKEKKQPLSAGVKRGLAAAFQKFDAYRLAKYNRDNAIKLRDVLFMVHAKPKDAAQAETWKSLIAGTLESPDTWEVELSAGKDKKGTFERLMREGKLGGLAALRNLRNMQQAGVDEGLIRERLSEGIARALPFRFVTAARHVPALEDAIEGAMLKATAEMWKLPGRTGILIDVSGSMDAVISAKSEALRLDAACGLAILLREVAERISIATFSSNVAVIPPRRGFGLRDAIVKSQPHASTMLAQSLTLLKNAAPEAGWRDVDRVIVITDEQSHDGIIPAFAKLNYVINIASNQNGVGYRNGWTHIDGWSERCIDYIRELETSVVG